MAKDNRNTLTPKLRFPQFRNHPMWDTKLGGELFDQTNIRGASAGLPILAITQEHGAIPRDEIDYHVSVTDKSIETYKEVLPGDFIISLRSFQGGIEYSKYHGICSPAYVVLRRKAEISDAFYKYLFKSHGFIQQLTKNLEGIRDGKMISYKQFSELLLPYPSSSEQQKIAECLSTLDELIEVESRKLDALKDHKKGLMQQLFPREGETRPRLRFPEFQNAGEWEETRLEHLGEVISGLTYSPDDVRESGLLVLRASNIQDGAIALSDNVYVDPMLKGVDILQSDDILICVRNGSKALIGKSALIPKGMPVCTHGAFMAVFRSRSPKFVFQLFQTPRYHKQVAGDLGATINSINGRRLLKYTFLVPKLAEQHRIAECLGTLDALTAAQKAKVEALRTHKRGLMQQLFPNPSGFES